VTYFLKTRNKQMEVEPVIRTKLSF